MKYRFKKEFNGKNFISLGQHYYGNYIIIKKTIEDSSLILYVKHDLYSLLHFINEDVEEIKSNYNEIIQGPKYFLIDYNTMNNLN